MKSPLLAFRFAEQRQKFQFAPKIGWRARAEGEPNSAFPNWRCLFENIRTEIMNDWLGGRKGKDQTPFPPASP